MFFSAWHVFVFVKRVQWAVVMEIMMNNHMFWEFFFEANPVLVFEYCFGF